jgi:hypothetical protein
LAVEARDRNGNPSSAPVPVAGGFAQLTAPTSGYTVAISTTSAVAANATAIADFTPNTSGDADIGLGLRCGATQCVLVSVSPKGKFRIAQLLAGTRAPVALVSDDVQVQLNQPNRLVVSLQGAAVQAWLNGRLLAKSTTTVPPDAGGLRFFNTDQDQAGPSTVNLSALYAFT